MSLAGQLIGALIATFLISRLILFIMLKWNGGPNRIIIAHVGSLLVASFVGGIGMADGGAFAGVRALTIYVGPQILWLILDLWRGSRHVHQ